MESRVAKIALVVYVLLVFILGSAIVLRNPTEEFWTATRVVDGCSYVVVRSVDGVAVTPALNQPETCYIELIKVN